MKLNFAIVVAIHFSTTAVQGAVVFFERQGDNLFVELREDITLDISMSGRELIVSLILDDVFSVSPASSTSGFATASTIRVTHTGGRSSSSLTSLWGVFQDSAVGQGLNDLNLGFNLRGVGSYSAGDQMIFSAGSALVIDYFAVGGTLPNQVPTTVRVVAGEVGGSRVLIAGPTPIPEPSPALILGLSLMLGLSRRER